MTSPESLPDVRIAATSFPEDAYRDTAVAAALMRQVTRGELEPTIRLHRTGPILAFGRLDKLRPGYRRAVRIASDAGYQPIERLAGGRAAVFHEGTISFSHAVRAAGSTGAYAGTGERFASMAGVVAEALSEVGVDARIGEVTGEYCPGEFSVNARGASKLAGIGQRVVVGGAHVGGVIVVRGAGRIRTVLEPIYEALELEWAPETTGSVAVELGESDETVPTDVHDPLIERTMEALRDALSSRYTLAPVDLPESTLALAERLRDDHIPEVR